MWVVTFLVKDPHVQTSVTSGREKRKRQRLALSSLLLQLFLPSLETNLSLGRREEWWRGLAEDT